MEDIKLSGKNTNEFGEIIVMMLAIGGILGGLVAMFFVFPLLSTLLGAFTGWVLSFTWFSTWIVNGLAVFGFTTTANNLYQVGAALGFCGAFFRSRLIAKTSDNK